MKTIPINRIPYETLKRLNAREAIITAADHYHHGRGVYVTTSLEPDDLRAAQSLGALETKRREEDVHAITMVVLRLDRTLIEEATSFLANRYRLIAELDTLLAHERDVYVVYVITHYNPEQKPCGPLTVNIGGDCYRDTTKIKDLSAILDRTKDLAQAMLRKAVMVFPDVPALHGGKKGEWIILDRDGQKIKGITEEGIIALGSAIIPRGIDFLNRYKEREAIAHGIYERFPDQQYIRPDSGSPDVLSGTYWRGEQPRKYINMCQAWSERGVDMRNFTCLPSKLGGTLDGSARPTGYGVATTTVELARRYFEPRGRPLGELQFLLEAAGNVGQNTIEALTEAYGVSAGNITVFDVKEDVCSLVGEKYGVKTITLRHNDFYEARLLDDLRRSDTRYDVWINNGVGDNTQPVYVDHLLETGVRVFTGGANNFLEVETQEDCRRRIFDAGGWAWPDPATSGGGWTLAVIDIMTRCQGREANTDAIRETILDTINSRNRRLVENVMESLGSEVSGHELWQGVDRLIEARVDETLNLELDAGEIFERADTSRWRLTG